MFKQKKGKHIGAAERLYIQCSFFTFNIFFFFNAHLGSGRRATTTKALILCFRTEDFFLRRKTVSPLTNFSMHRYQAAVYSRLTSLK